MMVNADDPNEDNSQAESSEDSCDEGGSEQLSPSQQSYESASDHDGDSIQIAQLSDSEHERRFKELDAEMSEKMQQIHQLMAGGGLTGATRFIEQNFHLTEDRVRPLIAAVPPKENGKAMRKFAKGNNGLSPRQQNINVNHSASHNLMELSQSMETIYHNAVEKRVSSSSEECVDISDETLELIAETEFEPDYEDEVVIPSTSWAPMSKRGTKAVTGCQDSQTADRDDNAMSPEEKAEKLIIEAEAAKAKIYPAATGKRTHDGNFRFIAEIDQDYLVIGGHIDELMRNCIIRGEYIEFGELLPKDRVVSDNEGRMELTMKNGRAYWTPVMDSVVINGFSRWEQAFRIFANIYTQHFPEKSGELIQYNHIIHSIAGQYIWENVYSYDKEFRMHIAQHPDCSWAVILQQAWSLKLKDRLTKNENFSHHHHNSPNSGSGTSSHRGKVNEPCRRYIRGKYNFGTSCVFDHRCLYEPCGKFGHSILNCRKLAVDKECNGTKREGGTPSAPRKDDGG